MTPEGSAFWRDKPVLVTGGTGFVGSRLAMKLVEYGARVVCFSRGRMTASELVRSGAAEQVTMACGDIRDRQQLENLFVRHEFDTVMHLAGQASVGVAIREPIATFESNVNGTWCLLDVCRRFRSVKQVIVASSDKAYGRATSLPYSEETPLLGQHPYDASKACADAISRSFANSYGLRVSVTRCANLFGGGDFNFERIVPSVIGAALRREAPVIRSDGKFIRDFLYIEDGVEAYLTLAQHLATRPELSGHAFNFSANEPRRILDLVQRILLLMGSSVEPVVLNNPTNELRAQHLSAEKAQRLLGWAPRFSVDQGLLKTIDWYRDLLTGHGPTARADRWVSDCIGVAGRA